MSVLGDLRTELVDALKASPDLDLNLYSHLPGRMTLPGAFVMAGSPYIEAEPGFDNTKKLVRFGIVLATQTGENQSETSALDDLIEAAQAALETDDWVVETISQPYTQSFSNADALVIEITVTSSVTFS